MSLQLLCSSHFRSCISGTRAAAIPSLRALALDAERGPGCILEGCCCGGGGGGCSCKSCLKGNEDWSATPESSGGSLTAAGAVGVAACCLDCWTDDAGTGVEKEGADKEGTAGANLGAGVSGLKVGGSK
eukprot:1152455-Pelagomonas_calceolata.AAC.2